MNDAPARTHSANKVASEWDQFSERGHAARKRFRDDARDQADFDVVAAHTASRQDPMRPGEGLSRRSVESAFFAPTAKEFAPLVSVVDDTLPYALFQRGFEQNLVCFCRPLSQASRHALQRRTILATLRRGIAAILIGHGRPAAANAVADVADALSTGNKSLPECQAALEIVGRTLAEPDEACWGPIFAGIELLDVDGDVRPEAVGWTLFRSVRLAAAIPARKAATSTVSGRASSFAISSRPADSVQLEEADLARRLALELQTELRAAKVSGWAALAPLVSEVDCYFSSVPERKQKNAAAKLGVDESDILGLIDLTVLGSAKCCVCFFADRVAFRNDWTSTTPGVFSVPFEHLVGVHRLGTTEIHIPKINASVAMAGTTLDRDVLIACFEALSKVTRLEEWVVDGSRPI